MQPHSFLHFFGRAVAEGSIVLEGALSVAFTHFPTALYYHNLRSPGGVALRLVHLMGNMMNFDRAQVRIGP